ncbi:MAG TPA: site-2 protease family protein [Mycobacteriales bacterium]
MRLFGFQVRPRLSFLLLGALAAISVAEGLRADLDRASPATIAALSILIGLGLLGSVLLHELAHALVGRRLGLPVGTIELNVLGGATVLGEDPPTPRAQYLVSVVGPVVNLLLAGVFGIAALTTDVATVPHDLAYPLFVINALLAFYNLLPGLPLDGGHLVRAAVWGVTGDKVTGLRAAGVGGLVTAAATFVLGLVELRAGTGFALATFLVAAFVGVQAQGALTGANVARRLPDVVAGRLARPAFVAGSDLPLAEALRRAAAAGRSAVVLGVDGKPSAVLSDVLLASVPDTRRPWVPLSSVSERVTATLDAHLEGEQLLRALREHPAPAYVVMDGGRFVGVLRAADVAARLRGRPGA